MNNQYKQQIEALQPLLKALSQNKIIELGYYITFDNPCLMILDKKGNVKDWFALDNETYNLLKEWWQDE